MNEDKINSNESEGVFNEFIHDQLVDLISDIVNNGTLDRFGDKSSDIIVEMDDINPPAFVYGDEFGSGYSKGRGPGRKGDKMSKAVNVDNSLDLGKDYPNKMIDFSPNDFPADRPLSKHSLGFILQL